MKTITGKVTATEYVGASVNGNPRYLVTLDNGETYRTMSDAMIAYAITNPEFREDAHVFVLTRAGRIRSAMTIERYLATTDGKDPHARAIYHTRTVARRV